MPISSAPPGPEKKRKKERSRGKQNEADNIEYCINTITSIKAPVENNKKVGTLIIKMNGKIIETVNILCSKEIERKEWVDYFKENVGKCRTIFENIKIN